MVAVFPQLLDRSPGDPVDSALDGGQPPAGQSSSGTRTGGSTGSYPAGSGVHRNVTLHVITLHVILADAFIQSDLQLIRLSRRHTPWSNVGLRALLKGPTTVQILLWPHLGSNHRPCGSKSIK